MTMTQGLVRIVGSDISHTQQVLQVPGIAVLVFSGQKLAKNV